jgi:hypothetical protein
VIPEVCANIVYSIVSAKRDAFRDASSICKTRVTLVTVHKEKWEKKISMKGQKRKTPPCQIFQAVAEASQAREVGRGLQQRRLQRLRSWRSAS